MLKEMQLKGIIESGKLETIKTIGEVEEVLKLTAQEFLNMCQYSESSKDSAPESTTDIDFQLDYETDDKEFSRGCARILINISDEEINNHTNMQDWKINTIQILL